MLSIKLLTPDTPASRPSLSATGVAAAPVPNPPALATEQPASAPPPVRPAKAEPIGPSPAVAAAVPSVLARPAGVVAAPSPLEGISPDVVPDADPSVVAVARSRPPPAGRGLETGSGPVF
ncbi:hypothetical protein GCM10009839_80310 [Catenulispora yoronensis]|uniref:Uncharacterized protein n=1 Tax=Catenulispora yoronensis TaxID=450799 RepID=A0ABN2VC04_9ACTN